MDKLNCMSDTVIIDTVPRGTYQQKYSIYNAKKGTSSNISSTGAKRPQDLPSLKFLK